MSEYVTSRLSASENSRATPCMSCDRGPVSSYIRPRCGPGSARTAATTRATSAAATGEVLPRPNGTTMRPRLRTVGAARGEKLSRNIVGRMVTTRQAGPRERLLTEPVLPLLTARGGVLNAHLGDGHLRHVDHGVHPDFPGDHRHGDRRFQVPGRHGHAEVDSPTAADDTIDAGRFEQVSDHHHRPDGP